MGDNRIGLAQPQDRAGKTNAAQAADALLKDAWTKPQADKEQDKDLLLEQQRTAQIQSDARAATEAAKKEFDRAGKPETLQEFQKTVVALLPVLNSTIKSETATNDKKDGDPPLDLKKIQQEVSKGEFGPELQRAYQWLVFYSKRVEDKVQSTFLLLDSVGLGLPPGFPIEPPGQTGGRKMADQLFRALLRSEELRLQLLKPGEFPDSGKFVDRVMNAEKWCADGAQLHMSELLPASCAEVAQLAREINRPGWIPPRELDKQEEWLARTAPLVDVGQSVKDLLKLTGALRLSTNQKDFPVLGKEGSEVPGIGALGSKDSPVRAKFDSDGRLVDFEIDLPDNLEPTYENRKKLEAIQQWLDTYGKQIRETAARVMETASDPDKVLVWADFPVGKKKDGSPNTFNDKEYNLESHRFDCKEEGGKIVVTSNIDYYYSGPLNMDDIGATSVGTKNFKTQTFEKWDLVPVLKDRKMVLMRADELKKWMDEQSWEYGKGKAISVGLNVGMILTGTFEAIGAYQAGRAVGMGVVRSMLTREFGAAMLHIGIGCSGILSSSYYTTRDWGRALQTAQHAYFMIDMVRGGFQLSRGGLAKAGWVRGAADAGKVSEVGLEMKNIFQTTAWLRRARIGSQVILKASEVGLASQLSHSIFARVGKELNRKFGPEAGLKELSDKAAREQAKQDAYFSEFLKGGSKLMGLSDAASKERLAELLKKTSGADGKPEDKLKEFATAYRSGNEDVKLAAAVGLLYLKSKEVKDNSGKLAGDITKGEALDYLEKQLTDGSSARRLFAAQALLGAERISGPEYALLCRDLLKDDKSPKEVKMRAIVGLGVSMTQAESAEASAKGSDRLNYLASSYGVTRSGLEQVLLDAARNEKDADLRAMAASALQAFNRDNKAYGWDLLLKDIDVWQAKFDKEPPEAAGAFAAAYAEKLKRDLNWDPASSKPQDKAGKDKNVDQVTEAEQRMQSKILAANLLSIMKPEGYKLEDSVRALNACVADGADLCPDVAAQAIKVLSQIAPAELASIQPGLISVLRADMGTDDAGPKARRLFEAKIQLLRSMPDYVKQMPPDKAKELVAVVESFLRKEKGNESYAGPFPEIRQAAVTALGAIYSGKNAPAKPDFELLAGRLKNDPSALVRAAALEALVTNKPKDLQAICLNLLKTEDDAFVLRRMRDVEFAVRRLDIDSAKYLRDLQNAIREIVRTASRNINNGSQFLRMRPELRLLLTDLDMEEWRRFRSAGFPKKGSTFDQMRKDIHDQVTRERETAFGSLKTLASGGATANQAREALVYLVVSNGKDMGATQDRKEAVERAAAIIEEICKDKDRQQDFSWAPEMCLLLQPNLSYKARQSVVNALASLNPRDDHPGGLTRERAALILAGALLRELSNTPKDANDPEYADSKKLQLELLKQLNDLNYKDERITPVLEAILRQGHPMKEVRDSAEQLLARNHDSTKEMSDKAEPMATITSTQRAELVSQALKTADAETVCRVLLAAGKNRKLTDQNDPLRQVVLLAAGDAHEQVQLAAARLLFTSTIAGDHEKAADIVARTLKYGCRKWYVDDANEIFSKLPESDRALVKARSDALKEKPDQAKSSQAVRADADWSIDYQDAVQIMQRELKEARRRELSKFASSSWWEHKDEDARKNDYGLFIESNNMKAKRDLWNNFLKQYFDEDSWNALGNISGALKAQAEFGNNVEGKFREVTKSIDDQMEAQFFALVETAKTDKGVAGQEARQALAYILLSNGQPFTSFQRIEKGKPPQSYRDWAVEQAADAICDICEGAKPGAGDLVWVLKTSMVEQPLLSTNVKTRLFETFCGMAGDNKIVSQKDAALVLAAAIDAQSSDWNSQQLLVSMLDKLKDWKNPQITPVLEAMAVGHPNFGIQAKAREIFALYIGAKETRQVADGAIFRDADGHCMRVSYRNGTFTQFEYDDDKTLVKIIDTRNNMTWTRDRDSSGRYLDRWTCDRMAAGGGQISVDDQSGAYTFTATDKQNNKRTIKVDSLTTLQLVEKSDGSRVQFLGSGKIVVTYPGGQTFSVTLSGGQPTEFRDRAGRTWKCSQKYATPGNPIWECVEPSGKKLSKEGVLAVSNDGQVSFSKVTENTDQGNGKFLKNTITELLLTNGSIKTSDTRKPDEVLRLEPDGARAVFDRFGQLMSFTEPSGAARQFTYEFGKLVAVKDFDCDGKPIAKVNLRAQTGSAGGSPAPDVREIVTIGSEVDPNTGAYFYRDSSGLKHGFAVSGAEIRFNRADQPLEVTHSKSSVSTLSYDKPGGELIGLTQPDERVWIKKESEGKTIWFTRAKGERDWNPRPQVTINVLSNGEYTITEGTQTTSFRHNGRLEQKSSGNPTLTWCNGVLVDVLRTNGATVHVEYAGNMSRENQPLIASVTLTDRDGNKTVWLRDKESLADPAMTPTWTAKGEPAVKGELKVEQTGSLSIKGEGLERRYEAWGADVLVDDKATTTYRDGIKVNAVYKNGPVKEEVFSPSGDVTLRRIQVTGVEATKWCKEGKLLSLGKWDGMERSKIDGVDCIVNVSGNWERTDDGQVKFSFGADNRLVRIESPNGVVKELNTNTNTWSTRYGKPLVTKDGNTVTIWRGNGEQLVLKLDDSGKVKSFRSISLDIRIRARSSGQPPENLVMEFEKKPNGQWIGRSANGGGAWYGYGWKTVEIKDDNSVVITDSYNNETCYSPELSMTRSVNLGNGRAVIESLDDRVVSIATPAGKKTITYESKDQVKLELPDGRKLVRQRKDDKFTNDWKCGDKTYKDLNIRQDGVIEWNDADNTHYVCNLDGKVMRYKTGEKVEVLSDFP